MQPKSKRLLEYVSGIIFLAILSLLVNYVFSTSKVKDPFISETSSGIIQVHYIDVGQGDSILIKADKYTMLIDAGKNGSGMLIANYLQAHNITSLDYVIETHPHIDHIGGLSYILRSFPVKQLIMSNVVHSTKTFKNLLSTIRNENINVKIANAGDHYTLGGASFTILAPISKSYKELNDYSVVIKLIYGKTSFLFDGDAQKSSEREMLNANFDLSSDVIKIAHHGAKDASSIDFLDKVHPTYAIISVGKNDYGIPDYEVLQELVDRRIHIYRTDKQGTIVFTSNGSTISVNTNPYIITQNDINDR